MDDTFHSETYIKMKKNAQPVHEAEVTKTLQSLWSLYH